MDKAKIYHSKLVSVMHEMSGLAEKTKMLKVRPQIVTDYSKLTSFC